MPAMSGAAGTASIGLRIICWYEVDLKGVDGT